MTSSITNNAQTDANLSVEASLHWSDYVEAAGLVAASLVGLVGNMLVLNLSLKIRRYARQVSLLFCGITCADILVCCIRLPLTLYLIFSEQPSSGILKVDGASASSTLHHVAVTTGISVTVTTADNSWNISSDLRNALSAFGIAGDSNHRARQEAMSESLVNGNEVSDAVGDDRQIQSSKLSTVDVACEVWAANGAIIIPVIWLHLVVATQRMLIIFSFSTQRKFFTQNVTSILLAATWVLGFAIVYAPLRVWGLRVERAGRGACRISPMTPHEILRARSAEAGLVATLPLLITVAFYAIVVRSVWRARGVRRDALAEYNRAIIVTIIRIATFLLTYLPVTLVMIFDIQPDIISNAGYHYLSYLFWAQSIVSPYVTLQDNDFREKMFMNNKDTQRNGNRADAREVVLQDLDRTIGPEPEDDTRERKRGKSFRMFQRAISFITSADLRTVRGSE